MASSILFFVCVVLITPIVCDEGTEKMYSDLFATNKNVDTKQYAADDTLEHLKELSLMPIANVENKINEKQIEKLISLANISEDKCNNDKLIELQQIFNEFSSYSVNIIPFVEHYWFEQRIECGKSLSRKIDAGKRKFLFGLYAPAQNFYFKIRLRSTSEEIFNHHLVVSKENLLKGLLCQFEYGEFISRDKYTEKYIKKKLNSKYTPICKKINTNFGPALEFYDSMSYVIKDVSYESRRWLAAARVCQLYLTGMKSNFVKEAYKYWRSHSDCGKFRARDSYFNP